MILPTEMLREKYSSYENPDMKIHLETKKGNLIRLRRGLYANDSGDAPLAANLILSPSYLSYEFACSFYGLIPEEAKIYSSASCLVGKKKRFLNPLGEFTYADVPSAVYPLDLIQTKEGVWIASKEKALCDLLSSKKPAVSYSDFLMLLFEDLRMDEDALGGLDVGKLLSLCPHYHRKNLDYLSHYFQKEKSHE